MENQLEEQELQTNPEGEGKPQTPTLEEIAELQRRAEVSSQNFERAKKAEAKLKELETQLEVQQQPQFTDDDYSDEGRAIRAEVLALKEEVASYKQLKEEESVFSKYPQVRERLDEFQEFLNDPEISSLSLEKAAKLFLVENDLMESETPARKGLEKPTSGDKGTIKKGLNEEDVKRLREMQPRKYEEMLRSGKLNPDEII